MERVSEWTRKQRISMPSHSHARCTHTAGRKSQQEVVRPAAETDYIIDLSAYNFHNYYINPLVHKMTNCEDSQGPEKSSTKWTLVQPTAQN